MFGSSKNKHKTDTSPATPSQPAVPPQTNQIQSHQATQPTHNPQVRQVKNMETLISESCTIEGNIKSDQSIKVDGKVEGNIEVKETLVISASGQVTGNIEAHSLVVYGHLQGDSQLKEIHIQDGGHIDGNIKTQSLKVDPNATYNGVVTMTKESLKPVSGLKNSNSTTTPESSQDKQDKAKV